MGINSKLIKSYFLNVWLKVGLGRYSYVDVLHIYRRPDKGGKYWKHIGEVKCQK